MIRPRLALDLALGLGLTISAAPAARAQQPATSPSPDTSGLVGQPGLRVDELGQPNVSGDPDDPSNLSRVAPSIFDRARAVTEPAARADALQHAGQAAVFSGQLEEARAALIEAGQACMAIPDPVLRDLRLIATLNSLISLADEELRSARQDDPLFEVEGEEKKPEALPRDRVSFYEAAIEAWAQGYELALRIGNPTYRDESLYRVVERQAYGSQSMVNENSPYGREGERRPEAPGPIRAVALRAIRLSTQWTEAIDRPVWRNLALAAISTNAATSRQFDEGLAVARRIRQPDSRAETLARLGQEMATNGDPDQATQVYAESALAAASISADGLRAVLAGVLIDNLISVGRFEDARACVTLYADPSLRIQALGAVADSMGRRGLSRSAFEWIEREVAPGERSGLQRRVIDGVLISVQQNRSSDLIRQDR